MGLRAGGSLLDMELPDQDPTSISTDEKRDAIKHIRPLVYDLLSFGCVHNATFHDNWFFDLQALISRERDFAEKNIDEFHADGETTPTAPTHFNTIESRRRS